MSHVENNNINYQNDLPSKVYVVADINLPMARERYPRTQSRNITITGDAAQAIIAQSDYQGVRFASFGTAPRKRKLITVLEAGYAITESYWSNV